jgi:MFS family permease
MLTFCIIWFGQFILSIGSYMTNFAIKLWAGELRGQVNTLALISLFSLIPSVFITLLSGLIVGRVNRKLLMIIGDSVAPISTIYIHYIYLLCLLKYLIRHLVSLFNW